MQPPKGRASIVDRALEGTTGSGMESRHHHPLPPFPAPKKSASSGSGTDPLSPADSVFTHQDSVSSDDYKSAPEHTPSPERGMGAESALPDRTGTREPAEIGTGGAIDTSTPQQTQKSSQQGNSLVGGGDVIGDTPSTGPGGQGSVERVSSTSPQNTMKISAFHKSLSDLAHTFSSILISQDEKEVLQSAE